MFSFLCAAFGMAGALQAVRTGSDGFIRMMGWLILGIVLLKVALRLDIRLFVPSLVVSFAQVMKLYVSLLLVAGLFLAARIGLGLQDSFGKVLFPGPYGTPERLGIGLATWGCLVFFQEWIFSFGYPPGIYGAARSRYVRVLRFSFGCYTIWGIVAAGFFGRITIFTCIAAAMMLLHSLAQTKHLATVAYKHARVARGGAPYSQKSNLWCLHITDVHLTTGRKQRAEGGAGGNQQLRQLVQQMVQNPPRFLFVTGDLTDHGEPEEWSVAQEILKPVLESGCRVLLVPGNHDMMTAYNSAETWVAIGYGHFRGTNVSWLNGKRLRLFLENAASMAPELMASNGQSLSGILQNEKRGFELLGDLVGRAHAEIQANPQDIETIAARYWPGAAPLFFELETSRLGLKDELRPGGIDLLRSQMSRNMLSSWPETLRSKAKDDFMLTEWPGWYSEGWYDYFPLSTFDTATSTQVFVVNSIANLMGLLHSAWGYLSPVQMYRLRHQIEASPAKNIVILVHHAPFRWQDEASPRWSLPDLQRWACLAAVGETTNEFVEILSTARHSGKEVYLFCGHRHGGVQKEARIGAWAGGKVAEGASLAQEPALLITGTQEKIGRLHLGGISATGCRP
jgi:3',5'-cyclic AMP phosphodiesterase CpdA